MITLCNESNEEGVPLVVYLHFLSVKAVLKILDYYESLIQLIVLLYRDSVRKLVVFEKIQTYDDLFDRNLFRRDCVNSLLL